MNLKKAKLLRKVLKKGGADWQDAKHVQTKDRYGNLSPTIFLAPECGRAIYQRTKAMARIRGG
jgi:hypothetical protein|tara:strand:- start:294 stop:482 length:189 start_codon:yes stop_codon:yes gene_type:complete